MCFSYTIINSDIVVQIQKNTALHEVWIAHLVSGL